MKDRFTALRQNLASSPILSLNLRKARRGRTAVACALLLCLLTAACPIALSEASEALLIKRALMRGTYLVGYPSDEAIPVRASEKANSKRIATLVSGDFALIGNGSLESRDAEVWPIQWWDANEGCVRSGWIDNQDAVQKHGALLLSPVKDMGVVGTVLDGGASMYAGHDWDSPQYFALQEGQSVYLIARYEYWILVSTTPFAQSEADPAAVGWLPMSSVGDAEGNPFAILG